MTKQSGSQRVERARRRFLEQGGRRLDLRLSREAGEALDRLTAETGESATALINRLLMESINST